MKAAVIGTGFIGPVHVEALRRAGVEVRGILGSSAGRSWAAAEELGIERAYADLQELVGDQEVGAVHITSPNQAHFEQASHCLNAGKHVLCEKPLAMNSSQSGALIRIAKEAGLAAGVNYNIRYYPLCIEAAERRRQGTLGEVRHVAGSYVQDWLFHQHDFNWRVLSGEGGPLRAVADIGTHWLDLVQYVTGLRVAEVCADLQTVFPKRHAPVGGAETFSGKSESDQTETQSVGVDTEDIGSLLLRFESGAKGVLWVSQVTAGRKNSLRWEIAAAKHAMSWDSELPNQLWIGHRDQVNQVLTRDPSLMQTRASEMSSYPGGHNEGFADTFKQLFRDFYQAIESGEFRTQPSYPSFVDGHREILICEAILESAKSSSWITVPS